MYAHVPVSELVELSITWLRADDQRLDSIFRSLKGGNPISEPIKLLNCGCGKTYMLEDGGHRITAAYRLFQETGNDVRVPVRTFVSAFQ